MSLPEIRARLENWVENCLDPQAAAAALLAVINIIDIDTTKDPETDATLGLDWSAPYERGYLGCAGIIAQVIEATMRGPFGSAGREHAAEVADLQARLDQAIDLLETVPLFRAEADLFDHEGGERPHDTITGYPDHYIVNGDHSGCMACVEKGLIPPPWRLHGE